MKYIYIAGLEHSGTTLLDHLLSQHPQMLGLGEIASFFSPSHMKRYMRQWGHLPDAQICSCGQTWKVCPFWGPLLELNGLNSNLPILSKYGQLVDYVKARHTNIEVIIDSSKSHATLEVLLNDLNLIGLQRENVHVVLLVKDVRNFAASIARKRKKTSSTWSHIRTFNWWIGANSKYLTYLKEADISFHTVLYEHLCFRPIETLNFIVGYFDLHFDQDLTSLKKTSHVAMGNKDFVIRNSDRVSYDYSWMTDNRINIAYALHRKARQLNQTFYQLSRS